MSRSTIAGYDGTTEVSVLVDSSGKLRTSLAELIAGERGVGTATGYMLCVNGFSKTELNPHTATTGTTITAGAAGNTEILVSATAVVVSHIVWAGDCAAGSLLLRDTTATGQSVSPLVITSALNPANVPATVLNWETTNGLTAIGTVAGISCAIFWRAKQS